MKSVGAPPTSSTTAPATDLLILPTEQTPGRAGPPSEIAPRTTLPGQGLTLLTCEQRNLLEKLLILHIEADFTLHTVLLEIFDFFPPVKVSKLYVKVTDTKVSQSVLSSIYCLRHKCVLNIFKDNILATEVPPEISAV